VSERNFQWFLKINNTLTPIDDRPRLSAMVEKDGDIRVDLEYPPRDRSAGLIVGLCDIRAANELRVTFDFEANEWVVEANWYERTEEGEEARWREAARICADVDGPQTKEKTCIQE
jgi:hypothetical protein